MVLFTCASVFFLVARAENALFLVDIDPDGVRTRGLRSGFSMNCSYFLNGCGIELAVNAIHEAFRLDGVEYFGNVGQHRTTFADSARTIKQCTIIGINFSAFSRFKLLNLLYFCVVTLGSPT